MWRNFTSILSSHDVPHSIDVTGGELQVKAFLFIQPDQAIHETGFQGWGKGMRFIFDQWRKQEFSRGIAAQNVFIFVMIGGGVKQKMAFRHSFLHEFCVNKQWHSQDLRSTIPSEGWAGPYAGFFFLLRVRHPPNRTPNQGSFLGLG